MAQKVFVGMSGGVDSSVAAALLVEQGYDVTGIYMKNWSQDLPGMQCPWAEDLADAKRVAVQLGIDFKVFDFERDYKQKVVDYMLEEYKLGRTPNPDVMCNQEVKFKLFLEACLEQGADLIATGHYARVAKSEASGSISSLEDSAFPAERGQERQLNQLAAERPERVDGASAALANDCSGDLEKESGTRNSQPRFFSRPPLASSAELIRAKDSSKDQTYFLYRVTGETLGRTIFPLGDYTKDEVREMAKERGLWTASKKESMGICFVGQVGIREFLSQYVKTRPGDIIDKQTSKVVGRHDGAIFYTLGQRHGLNIGGGLPYYVVGKDMDKNQIFVSRSLNDESLWREKILLSNEHWINQPPKNGTKIQVRLRHRGALIDAIYSASTLHLASAERAVAPGQSAVVYDGEVCLGGGIVRYIKLKRNIR